MSVRILQGDVREVLATLPADHFDCVVTSPPYWGLRDYGTAAWHGGDPSCDHSNFRAHQFGARSTNSSRDKIIGGDCKKCGAIRVDRQIGLEPTLAAHLAVMIDVFRAVRRVMKPAGTLWLNYGDCYATTPNGRSAAATKAAGNDDRTFRDKPMSTVGWSLKAKDLCMIPNRLAIVLQDDGWWVRSEIIWGKTNPMPDSSGRYRPSTAHEKIFLLTKSAKSFYDSEAVKVECSSDEGSNEYPGSERTLDGAPSPRLRTVIGNKRVKMPDNWDTGAGGHGSHHREGREKGTYVDKQRGHSRRHQGFNDRWDGMTREEQCAGGRLLRNYEPAPIEVWPMATAPFAGAHFATFPPKLVERCLTAACPKGGHVLDPFGGAGTVGLVADRMELDATLIELNPIYVNIAKNRIEDDAPLFSSVSSVGVV